MNGFLGIPSSSFTDLNRLQLLFWWKSCSILFSYHSNNKFITLLRKGVSPYEYMYDWEKLNETSLPGREDFYSHLNTEDITEAD